MQRAAFSRLARAHAVPRASAAPRRFASTEAAHPAAEVYPQEGESTRTASTLRATYTDPRVTPRARAGFNAPFWRTLSLAAIGAFLYSRLADRSDSVPSASDLAHRVEDQVPPYLTRYISHNLAPGADKYKERNEKHLELAKQAADDKLLFQEAERPRIRRLRYLG